MRLFQFHSCWLYASVLPQTKILIMDILTSWCHATKFLLDWLMKRLIAITLFAVDYLAKLLINELITCWTRYPFHLKNFCKTENWWMPHSSSDNDNDCNNSNAMLLTFRFWDPWSKWNSLCDTNFTIGVQFPASAKDHVMLTLGKLTLP